MLLVLMFTLAGQAAPLTKLIEQCNPTAIRHDACGDLDKQVWRRFTDVTGEITKINMRSIRPMPDGAVLVTTYTFSPGSSLDLNRLRQLYFTCRGQYADMANIRVLQDAPPRSVGGMIARVVCPIGNQKRVAVNVSNARAEVELHARAVNPQAEDYCEGFSAAACTFIKSGVDSVASPQYCRPGYGIVGSGLSREQLRICDARAPKDAEAGR